MATTEQVRTRIVRVAEMDWQDLAPGIRAREVWTDPATDRRALYVRIEPGASLPCHRHDGDEIVYVVEGSIHDEFGEVTAGNVGYRPDGCVHTVSSAKGATVYAIVTGSIASVTEPSAGSPASQVIAVDELAWVDALPGVRQKPVWQDPNGAERRALLARFEPGASLPFHRHVGEELIYVIEGASRDESGDVTPGNVGYRPDGCEHHVSTVNGATVFAVVWGHIDKL